MQARNVQLTSQPSTQLVLKGGIRFTGISSFTHKGTISLYNNPQGGTADWFDSTAGVLTAASMGKTAFLDNNFLQEIAGSTRFDSILVRGKGINLRQSNEVRSCLQLDTGLVYFSNNTDSILVSNPSLTAVLYNTDTIATVSWVHGRLSRRANSTAGAYFFPVGKILAGDSLYAPVRFYKQTTGTVTYSVQYFPAIPFDRNNKNPIIDHISNVEYWEITGNNLVASPDDDAVLELSWRDYSLVNATPAIRDSLLVTHYYFDGAITQWQPEFNPALPNIVNGNLAFGFIRTNKVVGDFSTPHLRFTIGTRSPQNLLPLQLLEWDVRKRGNTASCEWLVHDDRETEVYTIERSADGSNFIPLGTVRSLQQTGDTRYQFTDATPLTGMNFYRLKASGSTGQRYAEIRSLYFGANADWLLWPNPATELVNLQLPASFSAARLRLFDATGKQISQRMIQGNRVQLHVAGLPGGIYYIELQQDNQRSVKSFIKN